MENIRWIDSVRNEVLHRVKVERSNIGTKCNSLTQQFIGISTTIDIWAILFRLYQVIFRPSKTTDPIITRWSSALWDPQCLHNSIVTIKNTIM